MDPGTRYGGKKHEFCTAAFGDIFLLTLDSRLFHRIRRGGGIDIALGHPGFATDYILEISLSSQFSLRRNKPSQVWIRDLVKGGAPGPEAESCLHSKAESREQSEQFVAGVQGPLKGPGSFWVFDAQICILPHSTDSFSLIFDIYFNTKS